MSDSRQFIHDVRRGHRGLRVAGYFNRSHRRHGSPEYTSRSTWEYRTGRREACELMGRLVPCRRRPLQWDEALWFSCDE
jgi:hypothetical protein